MGQTLGHSEVVTRPLDVSAAIYPRFSCIAVEKLSVCMGQTEALGVASVSRTTVR